MKQKQRSMLTEESNYDKAKRIRKRIHKIMKVTIGTMYITTIIVLTIDIVKTIIN